MADEPFWPYQHASRGTCVPGCPRYGRCHCGCDVTPRISPANLRAAEAQHVVRIDRADQASLQHLG